MEAQGVGQGRRSMHKTVEAAIAVQLQQVPALQQDLEHFQLAWIGFDVFATTTDATPTTTIGQAPAA